MTKIIVLGDANVGKTSAVRLYSTKRTPGATKATICFELIFCNIPLASGGFLRAEIWDTAGQEKYRSVAANHYRRADGVLLFFSICDRASFENLGSWLELAKLNCEPDVPIVLVGSKCDVAAQKASERAVPRAEAEAFAAHRGLRFFEISAVTQQNVDAVFEHVGNAVWTRKTAATPPSSNLVSLNEARPAEVGALGCCSLF